MFLCATESPTSPQYTPVLQPDIDNFERLLLSKMSVSHEVSALISNLCKEFSIESQVAFVSYIQDHEQPAENAVVPLLIEKLKAIAEAETDYSKKKFMQKIVSRYLQLANSSKLHHLKSATQLHLAYYIEIKVGSIYSIGIKNLKPAHSVLITKSSISIENLSPLGKGKFKQVASALAVPLSSKAHNTQLVAIATMSKLQQGSDKFKAAWHEALLYESLKGLPGIWPLISTCVRHLDTFMMCEMLITMELAEGDLSALRPFDAIGLEQEISMGRDILSSLATLHSRHLVHRDVKIRNFLFKRDETGHYKVGLTDFGKAFDLRENIQKDRYGTTKNTPPELFENGRFVNHACDVWAAGTVLYEIHFKKAITWDTIPNIPESDFELEQVVHQHIQDHIEVPLKLLRGTLELTKAENFECLIYALMRQNPNERITAEQGLERLTI